jgi:hypothetical protein
MQMSILEINLNLRSTIQPLPLSSAGSTPNNNKYLGSTIQPHHLSTWFCSSSSSCAAPEKLSYRASMPLLTEDKNLLRSVRCACTATDVHL